MKREKGAAFIPVLLVIALAGAFASGLVKIDLKTGKPSLHKEVLKRGVAEYSVNQ